jgi:hypothetical protein
MRITILRMMIAIAVAGLALATLVGVWRRHGDFRLLARHHEQRTAEFARKAEEWSGGAYLLRVGESMAREDASPEPPVSSLGMPDTDDDALELKWEELAKGFAGLARHHAGLGRKYRRAAARPWLPVEPDPPPPELPVEPDLSPAL